MKCFCCKKDLPESEFYPSKLKNHDYICKKCFCEQIKEYQNECILNETKERDFERFYGGIKINIQNYPQAFEIQKTTGEYYITKSKDEFIKKLLDILK